MKSYLAAIVVLLSLQVAVAGRVPATVDGDVGAIRLPSHGLRGGAMAAERPWKCCDNIFKMDFKPPAYFCTDIVQRCADACKDCEKTPEGIEPAGYICMTGYQGKKNWDKCTHEAVAGGN